LQIHTYGLNRFQGGGGGIANRCFIQISLTAFYIHQPLSSDSLRSIFPSHPVPYHHQCALGVKRHTLPPPGLPKGEIFILQTFLQHEHDAVGIVMFFVDGGPVQCSQSILFQSTNNQSISMASLRSNVTMTSRSYDYDRSCHKQ